MTTNHIIRRAIGKQRSALSDHERQSAAQAAALQFSHTIQQIKPRIIALYIATHEELPTQNIIDNLLQNDAHIVLPIIHPFFPKYLMFQSYHQKTPLKANRFGILEPQLNCQDVIPVNQIDCFLMPLVSFNSQGDRLGMGAGFYDRTLQAWKTWQPYRIGYGFNFQLSDKITVAPWDVPLTHMITPDKTSYFNAREASF